MRRWVASSDIARSPVTRAQDAALLLYPSPHSEGATQVKCHQAACMIASGDVALGARHAAEVYQALPSSLRNGHMRTLISFA